MRVIIEILKKYFNKYFSIFIVLFCSLYGLFNVNYWARDTKIFSSDPDQHYSYLKTFFIHDDFKFKENYHGYWLTPTKINTQVPKVTMGLSYLYSPGFITGHIWAKVNNYPEDGISYPYQKSMTYLIQIYMIIALFFYRKALIYYFSDFVSGITIFSIYFGTNLFFYTLKEPAFPHSFIFCLVSLAIYFSVRWHETKEIKYAAIISFIVGITTLIRPNEIIILLPLFFIGVNNKEQLNLKIINPFFKSPINLILLFICFIIPWIPQILFWKINTGQLFFYSYGKEEGFFWSDPQILNQWFSYRKGWFLYTPLAFLLTIGSLILCKFRKSYFWSVLLFFLINVFILSCWWDWWFGGGFGMRAYVQSYPLLGIGLAAIYTLLLKKNWISIITLPLISAMIYINLWFTESYHNYLMHWDSMTKESLWYIIKEDEVDNDERNHLEELFVKPNYNDAKIGKRDQ